MPKALTVGPQPGKQETVFNTDVDFMLIGGSRGKLLLH